jgi:hypoxanthine phosphoribosyltransferase
VYLAGEAIAARVVELGEEIGADYAGRDLVLVGTLKASVPFVTDLSRALAIPHALDFLELTSYGQGGAARLLKDLDADIAGRDVLIVEDVVDTGLSLRYLCRTLKQRGPRSVAAATLLDRPYRRVVRELPLRYVGFVVSDELFVGYGFSLLERYGSLPDLHVLRRQS